MVDLLSDPRNSPNPGILPIAAEQYRKHLALGLNGAQLRTVNKARMVFRDLLGEVRFECGARAVAWAAYDAQPGCASAGCGN